MIYKRLKTILILLALAAVVGACLPGTDPADDDSADTIATAVAATLEAGEGSPPDTDAPPPSPTWTIHPTVTASAPETNFEYTGVKFYFNDLLADDITAGIDPGYYDAQDAYWSTPQHRVFKFNNWFLSNAFHDPAIRIYSVADFSAINENVSNALLALEGALTAQPLNSADLRVSDLFNAGQLYQSNPKAIRFQNGYGARWLSQYGQAYYPIGWPNLFYTFQGFTDDGAYYVSIILPVTHPSLPDADTVVMDDAFYENLASYMEGIQLQLEAESDNSFLPSLVLLDQLVASLLVGEP